MCASYSHTSSGALLLIAAIKKYVKGLYYWMYCYLIPVYYKNIIPPEEISFLRHLGVSDIRYQL